MRGSLAPVPADGRVFVAVRPVRLGDAGPGQLLHLDALAGYLQDVAEDDAADAGVLGAVGWVLRRTSVVVHRLPRAGELLRLETYCSGTAPRWAERTTRITGDQGGSLQAVAIWVAIDPATGGAVRLGKDFERVYGPSAAGRRASARLRLTPPTSEVAASGRPWSLRASDVDVWRHVNNAISWAALEDVLVTARWWRPEGGTVLQAEVEHHDAIDPGAPVRLASRPAEASIGVWLLDGEHVLTAARLRAVPTGGPREVAAGGGEGPPAGGPPPVPPSSPTGWWGS